MAAMHAIRVLPSTVSSVSQWLVDSFHRALAVHLLQLTCERPKQTVANAGALSTVCGRLVSELVRCLSPGSSSACPCNHSLCLRMVS